MDRNDMSFANRSGAALQLALTGQKARRVAVFTALHLICLLAAGAVHASCGSAFCVLDTSWSTQGVPSDPGTMRLDLRYEFVDQSQLRSNRSRIAPENDNGDTRELRTVNRNWLATLDYTFSQDWAASVALPYVDRVHSHITDPTGNPALDEWRFAEIGDVRVLGQRRFASADNPLVNYGLNFGLKLPTGNYRVSNADGTQAERSLQPGTGSTDVVLGGYYARPGFQIDSSWFVQALLQKAVRIKDEFRPGAQYTLSAGYRQGFTPTLSGLLQVNSLFKKRDAGLNAEPDLSGSRSVFLSPGLNFAITPDVQIYGFVQLPVYRQVNGVQLSANRALVGGISVRF